MHDHLWSNQNTSISEWISNVSKYFLRWCLPTGCFNWAQTHLVFLKMYFSEGMKGCFLWILHLFFVNIIIIHVFPEKFIKISQVFQKIQRFSSSILTFFVTFLDFLAFPCYRELKVWTDNRWHQHCYLRPTSNGLFDSCIKLHRY